MNVIYFIDIYKMNKGMESEEPHYVIHFKTFKTGELFS